MIFSVAAYKYQTWSKIHSISPYYMQNAIHGIMTGLKPGSTAWTREELIKMADKMLSLLLDKINFQFKITKY